MLLGEEIMAAADYRLCDICGGKVFYDSNLNYEFDDLDYPEAKEVGIKRGYNLDYLGDWAVLCNNCSKEYKTDIVKK